MLSISAEDLLLTLLQQGPGVAVGEHHADLTAAQMLAANMKNFADAGVKILFVEMFDHRDQDMLDHFQITGDLSKEFPGNRARWNRSLDWELNRWAHDKNGGEVRKQSYIDLLEAAREHGIKLIAIDDADTIMNIVQRQQLSNPVWVTNIRKGLDQMAEGEKFLVHGGYFHFSGLEEEANIDPVSKTLGIPSVLLQQTDKAAATVHNGNTPFTTTFTCDIPAGQYAPATGPKTNNQNPQQILAYI